MFTIVTPLISKELPLFAIVVFTIVTPLISEELPLFAIVNLKDFFVIASFSNLNTSIFGQFSTLLVPVKYVRENLSGNVKLFKAT